jgi:DNA-directed RNA polymerase specialized sigma24 family protein
VDEKTMQAFRLYAMEQWPPGEVSAQLGLSRNAVYLAKNHVLSRMRDLQRQMEAIF